MAEHVPRDVSEIGSDAIHHMSRDAVLSPFTCPDCGGALAQTHDGDLLQFQCHVGHRFSGESLEAAQSEALDHALWAGLRALEESIELRRRMAQHAEDHGMDTIAANYHEQAHESELRAGTIRRVLMPDARTGNPASHEEEQTTGSIRSRK